MKYPAFQSECLFGDARTVMRELMASDLRFQTCVTSPPYWNLRDYKIRGQYGLERTPQRYLARMRSVFRLVWHLLEDDGTLWLNMGDSYSDSGNGGHNHSHKGLDRPQRFHGHQVRTGDLTGCRRPPAPGFRRKNLMGMPWRLALILQTDGWYLRSDIIWSKPNPMPESVRDRPTRAHEYIFLLSKRPRYYYDHEAISEEASPNTHPRMARHKEGQGSDRGWGGQKRTGPMAPGVNPKSRCGPPVAGWDRSTGQGGHGTINRQREKGRPRQNESFSEALGTGVVDRRNKRTVWTIGTEPYSGAHYAVFPQALVEPCILAGSRPGDVVFDPFFGSGTVGQVAQRLGRRWLGIELDERNRSLQAERIGTQEALRL